MATGYAATDRAPLTAYQIARPALWVGMSSSESSVAALSPAAASVVAQHARSKRRRRWLSASWFWIRRYLPAELAGTVTMIIAGVAIGSIAVPPIVIGIVASEAEGIGFYAVAGIAVWREQRRLLPTRGRLRTLLKVTALLVFEFGPAELLDTFLIRPLFLTVAVQAIPGLAWALIVGKIAADIVFYVLAATAFRVTEATGVRGTEPTQGAARN